MDRMQDGAGANDKLDALWAEYREAVPDPDASAQFMPSMWRRIEERRAATTSVFRRLSQVFVVATAALTIFMAVVLIPRLQREQVFSASYVEVLAADHDYTDLLK
jgi:hypothetical protein